MKSFLLSLAFFPLFLSFNQSVFAASSQVPDPFIDGGACPFECCTYREWSVEKDTILYNKPNGKKVVGTVKKGELVKGVTGFTSIKPTPMTVVYPHKPFKVGETVYLLTPLGEGFRKVWHKGKISEEELIFLYSYQYSDPTCKKPTAECWGRVLKDFADKMIWWVKIQPKNGPAGWSKDPQNFGNIDACG